MAIGLCDRSLGALVLGRLMLELPKSLCARGVLPGVRSLRKHLVVVGIGHVSGSSG